ncbi:MAG: hypothetical protein ACRDKY_11295 [Solirubrobacteraceae bacterium]
MMVSTALSMRQPTFPVARWDHACAPMIAPAMMMDPADEDRRRDRRDGGDDDRWVAVVSPRSVAAGSNPYHPPRKPIGVEPARRLHPQPLSMLFEETRGRAAWLAHVRL